MGKRDHREKVFGRGGTVRRRGPALLATVVIALIVILGFGSFALLSIDFQLSRTQHTSARERSDLPCEHSDDPLVAAAMAGTATSAHELLSDGADPDAGDSQGRFALSCAAFSGNVAVVEVLLDAGTDLNTPSDEGGTPIQAAVIGGSSLSDDGRPTTGVAPTDSAPRLEIIDLLAKAGAMLDLGVTDAARVGSVVALDRLLKLGANPNGAASERSPLLEVAYGFTPDASVCTEGGACEVLDLLVAAGADPDDGGTSRTSDLSLALLLRREARGDAGDLTEIIDRIEGLDPQTGNVPPVVAAALSSNRLLLQRLMHAGADPNALAFDVIPPLWAAVVAGDQQGVRMLLDAGADPAPDVPSWAQPLDVARAGGQQAIEALLTESGG